MRYFRALMVVMMFVIACERVENIAEMETEIVLDAGVFDTKSKDPDSENEITDVNLLVFNSAGKLETYQYVYSTDLKVKLVKGEKYSIYVMANLTYQPPIKTLKDLKEYRFWIDRPDEYPTGLPMMGYVENTTINSGRIVIPLTRLMSKVNVRLDKSQLDKDISFFVTSVTVGNCPRYIDVFKQSGVDDEDFVFVQGFSKDQLPASLYLLENVNPIRKDKASYIELKADYISSKYYTKGTNNLIYRFYIDDGDKLGVERNCIYNITVIPKGDGLGGVDVSDWRIDKNNLIEQGGPSLQQYPSDYIECHIGDKIHIGCLVNPSNAPFDVGEQYLEADQETGIYDYEIDADGKGAWLTMKKGGMGWVYMEAGEPINDAALFVIMCEP